MAISEKPGGTITHIDDVLTGLERIDGMLTDDSHRAYAVKVLANIPQFVSARQNHSEAIAIHYWLLKIGDSLSGLPRDFKKVSGSELIRTRMMKSADLFLET